MKNNFERQTPNSELEDRTELKALAYEIGTLLQSSAQQGLLYYRPIAARIISGEMSDPREIERTLDFMLDFCYEDKMLQLFKRVCRSLLAKYPALVYNAVMNYKEVWDNNEDEYNENNSELRIPNSELDGDAE